MTSTRVPAAADLDALAARAAAEHARDRAVDPLLGSATSEPSAVRPLLDGLEGTVVRGDLEGGGEVAAAWLARPAGGALAAPAWGLVGEPATLREAYALAAGAWLDAGHRTHTAVIRAADAARHEALVDLGFGHEQAYAVLDLSAADAGRAGVPQGVDVRPGTLDDLPEILPLAPVIGAHQVASPVFARVGPDFFDGLAAAHRAEIADPEAHYLVARVDGSALGFAIWYEGVDGPFMDASYAELSVAAVAEEARGRGVGLALTAAVVEAARAHGATRLATDWRTTNLLSSAFWPARGFQVLGWRMSRTIDAATA